MSNNAQTSGRRGLLLTRPQDRSEQFIASLTDDARRRAAICISPVLEIVPTGALPELADAAGVIFTSAQAISLAPKGAGRDAYCVGESTADAARRAGWRVRSTQQDAAHLVNAIQGLRIEGPLVHLAGQHRRGEIAERLSRQGVPVRVITTYDQVVRPLTQGAQDLLSGEAPVIVPLFSPRSAAQFVTSVGVLSKAHIVAMSAAVAEALGDVSVAGMHIVDAPRGGEMTLWVEKLLNADTLA